LDLSFVTLTVTDKDGRTAPRAKNAIQFSISGPGEIVATDNGDPTDFTVFGSTKRKAFNGLALVIVRARRGQSGKIIVTAQSDGFADATIQIVVR
jgi:beta-galactosidase